MGSRPCRACRRPSGSLQTPRDAWHGAFGSGCRSLGPSPVAKLSGFRDSFQTAFHPAGDAAAEEWGKESPSGNALTGV